MVVVADSWPSDLAAVVALFKTGAANTTAVADTVAPAAAIELARDAPRGILGPVGLAFCGWRRTGAKAREADHPGVDEKIEAKKKCQPFQ